MTHPHASLVAPLTLLKDGQTDVDLASLVERLNELLGGQRFVASFFNEGGVGGPFGGILQTAFDQLEEDVTIVDFFGTRTLLVRTRSFDIRLPVQTLKPGGDLPVRCPAVEIDGDHIKFKNPYVDTDQSGRRIRWQHYCLTVIGSSDTV